VSLLFGNKVLFITIFPPLLLPSNFDLFCSLFKIRNTDSQINATDYKQRFRRKSQKPAATGGTGHLSNYVFEYLHINN
jgi:hypothetical protein